MFKKKIQKVLYSKIGITTLFLLTFIFLFAIVLNNIGLSFREKITLDQTLDFSWFVDSIERLLHGYVQGRDFTFTYGPLFQLIYSLPSLIFRVPSYISVAISPILSFVITFMLVFRISKFLTKDYLEQIAYILFVFIILGLIISNSDFVRIIMLLFYSLELFQVFQNKFQWFRFFLVTALPTVLGMFSYNLFILTFAFSMIFVALKLYERSKDLKLNLRLLLVVPAIITFQVVFSLLFTHNLSYIFNSFDSVSNYRYIMDLTWTRDRSNIMVVFPVALVILGIYLIKTKIVLRYTRDVLLILILSSFVALISIISRSDAGHLIFGIYPSLITFFTIIFVLSKQLRGLILVAFILYLLVPVKPTLYNTLAPKNIFKVVQVLKDKPSFFSIYKLPPMYFSDIEINQLINIISKNKNKVFVYPYDSYLLDIENSIYNSFALGLYTYSNSLVEENTVKGFIEHPPYVIILEVDTKGALNLDNIPNLTRNPLLAKWMIDNYNVSKITPKYLILSFNANKKKSMLSNQCKYYKLTIDLSKKESLLQKIEDLIKPPIYYLNDIRLPYSSWSKNYLIFDNIYSSSGVSSLFEINSNKYPSPIITNKTKGLEITRVSPFLAKKEIEIFNKNEYSIECQ